VIERLRELMKRASAEHAQAKRRLAEERAARDAARRLAADCEAAFDHVQKVAEGVQRAAHEQVCGVVTRALASVFADPYEFRIIFERKRGQTEARLVFVRRGHEYRPTRASALGAVEVAALALRLSCLLLARPAGRRLLVLDEPMKNVHGAENRRRTAALIETLARDMGVQFLLVTGLDWLKIGRVIELD
jgi:DNA repair exonuclease SbcCD ATPase subunit